MHITSYIAVYLLVSILTLNLVDGAKVWLYSSVICLCCVFNSIFKHCDLVILYGYTKKSIFKC